MSETKHTPRPWKVVEWTTDGGRRYISVQTDYPASCRGSCSIACMTGSYYTKTGQPDRETSVAINRANADLIAAAPELEHELGGIADALTAGETVVIEPGSVKASRIAAAIAAATGD